MFSNLQKGQKIDLVKKDGNSLRKIMVGLGWDAATYGAQDIDCDAAVFLCGDDGKLIDPDLHKSCVSFHHLRLQNNAIVHNGDNRTGAGDGDDETIDVDLDAMPANIVKLAFTVNIYKGGERGQHFGAIRNAYVRLVDLKTREEFCRFNLSEDYSGMLGIVVGEI